MISSKTKATMPFLIFGILICLIIWAPAVHAKGQIKDGFFLVHQPEVHYGVETFFQALVFFEDQERNGVALDYYQNEDVQNLLSYDYNRLNGTCVGFYQNGQTAYRLSYRNGLRHGSAHYYFEDGKPRAVVYFHFGQPDGPAKFYNRNGKLIKMALFDRGRLAQVK